MPGGGCGVERPRVEVTQDTTDKLGGLAVDKLLFFIAGTIVAPADPRQCPMTTRRAAWPQPSKMPLQPLQIPVLFRLRLVLCPS